MSTMYECGVKSQATNPRQESYVGFVEAGICFGSPGEGVVEFCFGDFVIVVDELPCLVDGVPDVVVWRELVGVPGQVDVEGGDCHA